jgi:hypothetical protein
LVWIKPSAETESAPRIHHGSIGTVLIVSIGAIQVSSPSRPGTLKFPELKETATIDKNPFFILPSPKLFL